MIQILLTLNDEHITLIGLVTRTLGDYSQYDELSIYEHKDKFEVITRSVKKQYVTRTYVGKFSWRVLSSYCKSVGQEEVELYSKNKQR